MGDVLAIEIKWLQLRRKDPLLITLVTAQPYFQLTFLGDKNISSRQKIKNPQRNLSPGSKYNRCKSAHSCDYKAYSVLLLVSLFLFLLMPFVSNLELFNPLLLFYTPFFLVSCSFIYLAHDFLFPLSFSWHLIFVIYSFLFLLLFHSFFSFYFHSFFLQT